MLKHRNRGQTIEFDLPTELGYKGWSIECVYIFDKMKEKYRLSMYLKWRDIPDKFKIDSQEIDTQYISGTRETIRTNICKLIEQAVEGGFFDSYIDHFNYTYKCFDIGDDVLCGSTVEKESV